MKKIITGMVIVITFAFVNNTFAQDSKYNWLAQDSWSFSFGAMYPHYVSTNLNWVEGPQHYGIFATIQRNFSEHVGIRAEANYLKMGGWTGIRNASGYVDNKLIGVNIDLLYYLAPSEPISPYLGVGFGGYTHTISGSPVAVLNDDQLDYQYNAILGAEWSVTKDWRIKTEVAYHSAASSAFDGVYGTSNGGTVGGSYDSYMTAQLGLVYYFQKGEPSKLNDLYTGIDPKIDYDKIESIVKKYSTEPTVVDYNRIEDIVKKYAGSGMAVNDRWALIGVNFEFDKSSLTKESFPILYNAAEILLTHPEVNVEIQGYTDNVGSETYNQKLSEMRAVTVKNFLISKGVAVSRLTTVGFGESRPVVDNNTASNRALNRRIEFRVK